MVSLARHEEVGYLHNAETIAKVPPKLNIKLHEWNKPSTTGGGWRGRRFQRGG